MNNKRLGMSFEKEFVEKLAARGYWVHFIVPDSRGAQPFDVIAVKDGVAHAIDCKTCTSNTFSISRLEDNQISAFEKWLSCKNTDPIIAVKHDGRIYTILYSELKAKGKIKLEEAGS